MLSLDSTCIFCQIATGKTPCHKIWENRGYLAFLSIYPNTEGFTVVIPKYHLDSYIFAHPPEEVNGLMEAAREVSTILVNKLPDVQKTALVFEGYGVFHLHAKLIPLHGTVSGKWKEHVSTLKTKFELYPGYISTHDTTRESDEKLAAIATKLTE